MHTMFLRATAWVAAALILAVPGPGTSQATPYVATLDPAYRDLDALVARGLVSGVILGQRPYSRMTFARMAAEARGRAGGGEVLEPRFAEALERLEARFAEELGLLCTGGDETCPPPRPYAAPREARAEATFAGSPSRAVPSREVMADPLLTGAELDADVNPLLQRNQGRALADGWTVAAEAQADLVLGRRIAGQLQPRAWVAEGDDGGTAADVTLVRGYARALFGNLSVDVGRNLVPHGHAHEYGVAVSGNVRGMDMVRLSMERPARLPWIFRHLGPMQVGAYVGDLGQDRDNPGGKLIVIEGAIRPHRNLELGGILLNQQFGEGIKSANLGRRLRDILGLLPRRWFYGFESVGEISDKAASLDARLTLPSHGLDLYTEVLTTDDHNLFAGWREAFWNDAAWVWGGRLVGIGPDGRFDARIEASRVGVRPYAHHRFTSGMTLDRRVIGTPLGPLASGVTGALEWNGAAQTLGVAWAWERYSGDRYQKPDADVQRLVRIADNPDEVRVRATLDWTRQAAVTGLRTTVRLGYEHVTRFDFTDRNRSNFLAQVGVGYVW